MSLSFTCNAFCSSSHSGLGIGTSPKAFVEHGINTTIVELDPVVHEFATKYFGLPENHHAYIQDASDFVSVYSEAQPNSYDYIIHDVFTGGAEPIPLFTLEFLQRLDKLLRADGVVAINYAADLTLETPNIVVRTILEVFPTCRIFQDVLPGDSGANFINMVVFCTKAQNSQVIFREATEADWLQSLSRKQWIPPDPVLEMPISDFLDEAERRSEALVLKTDNKKMVERLKGYHHISADRHWRIMRKVLPDAVWELW